MATLAVSTSQNYSALSFNDYDRITVSNGATLTIDTDTDIIERLLCITLGKALIKNTSTTTPIFVKTGSNDTANAQIRFEAGGIFEAQGEWIDVGTSDGTADQTFTLPTNASSDTMPLIPTLFIFEPGETKPVIYNRVSSLTDMFGDEKLGVVFEHDDATNTVTLGDGTEGYIPPNGAVIRVPNIMFIEESSTSARYTDWDISTSGTVIMDKVNWSDNYSHNYSSGTAVNISNSGFGLGREDMSFASTPSPSITNCGVLMQNNNHIFSLSGCNNPYLDNVFIYTLENGANYHGFYPVNAAGGSLLNCKVIAPDLPASTSRAGLYGTSAGVTIRSYTYAGAGVGINIGAAASGLVIEDVYLNAAGKRNPSAMGDIGIQSANSSDNLIQRVSSYPNTVAEGLVPFDSYFISLSTGTSNYTVNDIDCYAGVSGDANRMNNPLFCNGLNHRVNNFRITGDYSSDTINHSTASSGCSFINITQTGTETSSADVEWTDGSVYEFVATSDQLDVAPSATGVDVGTLSLIRNGTNSGKGYIYKPMGAHPSSGLLNEITVNGSYFFNNAGALYMDTAGDVLEFIGSVHGGVTDIEGWSRSGTNNANFAVEFSMRVPNGTWTAYQGTTTALLSSTLLALPGYDSDVGFQVKFRVTRSASNLTDFLYMIRLDTVVDTGFMPPFEVFPTKATFSGVTVGDVIYVEDASNSQKLFTTATTTDNIEMVLPNANDGETWTYVIKRAGFAHQRGTLTIEAGTNVSVAIGLLQKQQPTGGAMYTASTPTSVAVDFDLVTPQMSIDVSAADITAQNVFDATENALITNDGMKWLAQQNTDTALASLGGAGSFLFHADNIRVRRESAGDTNAGVSAYVFSTQAQPVDESNGTVNLFSGTLVANFLSADFDDADGVSVTVGQLMSRLNNMIELSGSEYRYKQTALTESPVADVAGLAQEATVNALNNLSISDVQAIVPTTSQIEAALLNEGDGQQLIDAIVTLINSNLDLPSLELAAIAAQVRVELSTELARIDANVSSAGGSGGLTLGQFLALK